VKDILTYVGCISGDVDGFCTGVSAKEPYFSTKKSHLSARE